MPDVGTRDVGALDAGPDNDKRPRLGSVDSLLMCLVEGGQTVPDCDTPSSTTSSGGESSVGPDQDDAASPSLIRRLRNRPVVAALSLAFAAACLAALAATMVAGGMDYEEDNGVDSRDASPISRRLEDVPSAAVAESPPVLGSDATIAEVPSGLSTAAEPTEPATDGQATDGGAATGTEETQSKAVAATDVGAATGTEEYKATAGGDATTGTEETQNDAAAGGDGATTGTEETRNEAVAATGAATTGTEETQNKAVAVVDGDAATGTEENKAGAGGDGATTGTEETQNEAAAGGDGATGADGPGREQTGPTLFDLKSKRPENEAATAGGVATGPAPQPAAPAPARMDGEEWEEYLTAQSESAIGDIGSNPVSGGSEGTQDLPAAGGSGAGVASVAQGEPSVSDELRAGPPALMPLKPVDILEKARKYGALYEDEAANGDVEGFMGGEDMNYKAELLAREFGADPPPDDTDSTNLTVANKTNGWIPGTWTTGYWDCCKPSCSWSGKGNVKIPVQACDAQTGERLANPDEPSVCQGGRAASCANNQPFVVNERLSMGFAAAAVGGASGLTGDANCGQCFELFFTPRQYIAGSGRWGGAHPWLAGRTMIVQVTNIGYDVTGEHSFDIQIPGAGQGIFDTGCVAQFPNHTINDFDCDVRYGGCPRARGCKRLPQELQAGCLWRFEWYKWMGGRGRTNNPWVEFRRVQCPVQLTDISGSIPLDDAEFPAVDISHFETHPFDREHLVRP